MKTSDFINEVAEKTGLKKAEVEKVYKTALDLMYDKIKTDESFRLPFGSFKIVPIAAREERTMKNPRTGEEITVAARPEGKKLKFEANKETKEEIFSL